MRHSLHSLTCISLQQKELAEYVNVLRAPTSQKHCGGHDRTFTRENETANKPFGCGSIEKKLKVKLDVL